MEPIFNVYFAKKDICESRARNRLKKKCRWKVQNVLPKRTRNGGK